ncbi:hypothetical protein MUO65_05880 [bacterium]|nr:hypothetical protein [bacterium]
MGQPKAGGETMVVRFCVYARREGLQEKGSLVEDFPSREEAETYAGIESPRMESDGYELCVLEKNMPERRTELRAQELVKELRKSGDMITFVIESCKSAAAFGMYGEYNRSLFTRELQRQLENFNRENWVTAQTGSEALRELLKFVEEKSSDLPEEEDIKAIIWKIAAQPGLRFVSREFDEEIKCPGCNWGTLTLFALETEKDIERNGLCGQCCMETIVAEQIKIPCDELNLPAEIVEGQLAEAVKIAEGKP